MGKVDVIGSEKTVNGDAESVKNQNYDDLYRIGSEKFEKHGPLYVYNPQNPNLDKVDVVVYFPGAGGCESDDVAYREYVANNPDKVVIIWEKNDNYYDNLLEELESVKASYNIGSIDTFGHSAGEGYAVRYAAKLNDDGYHVENVVVTGSATNTRFLISQPNNYDYIKYRGYASNFANNGTKFLVFNESEITDANREAMQPLVDAGVTVGFVYCDNGIPYDPNDQTNRKHFDAHGKIKVQVIRDGLISVLAGKKFNLDADELLNYYYSFYDYELGQWVDEVDPLEFWKSYIGLGKFNSSSAIVNFISDYVNTYSGTIFSDYNYVADAVAAINNILKGNDSSSSNLINNLGDNPIIAMEDALITYHLDTSSKLLEKVYKETLAIISYADSTNNLEQRVNDKIEQLPQ